MIDDTDWTIDAKPLMFLDLKLGNICNLKCRICGSWSSSAFATEELQFMSAEEKKTSHHYIMLKQGAWPRENTNFWDEIDRVLDQIRYIEFTGGEPFMIREHSLMSCILKTWPIGLIRNHLILSIGTCYTKHGT
jgi:MoaA/NifB/PqqE/SkfB family radical SAM enzyme